MTATQLTCRHCCANIEAKDRFCWDCGIRLLPAAEQSTPRFTSPLLEQKAPPANPLLNAEVILAGTLSVFVISMVAWNSRSLHLGESGAHKTATKVPGRTLLKLEESKESEFSRLMTAAKSLALPYTGPAVPLVDSDNTGQSNNTSGTEKTPEQQPKTPLSSEPQKSGAAVQKIAKLEAVELKAEQTASRVSEPKVETAEPKATRPAENPPRALAEVPKTQIAPKSVKNAPEVAEYNRLLASYFARKNESSGGGATAGGEAGTAASGINISAEPPSFEEWLGAGKPEF